MKTNRKNGLLSAYGFGCGYFQKILENKDFKIEVHMNLCGIYEVVLSKIDNITMPYSFTKQQFIFGFSLLNEAYKAANSLKKIKDKSFEELKSYFENFKSYEGECIAIDR